MKRVIYHRHGGTVTPTHVGHATDRGVPYWYVRCDVAWDDGGHSKALLVSPTQLVYRADVSGSEAALHGLMKRMNQYLAGAGEWLKTPRRLRSGVVIHWQSNEKSGEQEL